MSMVRFRPWPPNIHVETIDYGTPPRRTCIRIGFSCHSLAIINYGKGKHLAKFRAPNPKGDRGPSWGSYVTALRFNIMIAQECLRRSFAHRCQFLRRVVKTKISLHRQPRHNKPSEQAWRSALFAIIVVPSPLRGGILLDDCFLSSADTQGSYRD